jgi:hypothetical protein
MSSAVLEKLKNLTSSSLFLYGGWQFFFLVQSSGRDDNLMLECVDFFLGSKHGRKKESNLHKITTLEANAAAARYSAVQPRWKFPELPTHAPHPIPAVKYVSLALLTPLPPWSQPSPSPLHAILSSSLPRRRADPDPRHRHSKHGRRQAAARSRADSARPESSSPPASTVTNGR